MKLPSSRAQQSNSAGRNLLENVFFSSEILHQHFLSSSSYFDILVQTTKLGYFFRVMLCLARSFDNIFGCSTFEYLCTEFPEQSFLTTSRFVFFFFPFLLDGKNKLYGGATEGIKGEKKKKKPLLGQS
jgi:hypothetical protein